MGIVASTVDEDDLLREEEYEELEGMSGFNKDELRKLYKRFRALDRSGNGTLGEEDLLRIPGVAMNPMVDRVVGYFGFGPYAVQLAGKTTNRVNFPDFVRALSLFNDQKPSEEKLEHVFRSFDLDGDGKISRDEFKSVLRTLVGKSMEENDIDDLVEHAFLEYEHLAQEENAGLDFREFCETLQGNSFLERMVRKSTLDHSGMEEFHRKREKELRFKG